MLLAVAILQPCLFFNPQHYPDYYAIIKEPIDLRTIAQRIQVCPFCCDCVLCLFPSSQKYRKLTSTLIFLSQSGSYKNVNAMAKDIDLLAKNAKTYNEPGSQVFKVRPCVDDDTNNIDNNVDVSQNFQNLTFALPVGCKYYQKSLYPAEN